MPGTVRADMRALGYLGAAPIYHKDQRLSEEVIYSFMTDDWDERVDAVSRGLLGMTVACARCHDHKFDPILTKDYYGLAGVFASTRRAVRPMFDVDPATETRYMWVQNRLFDLRYSANLLTNEASTVENSAPRVAKWRAEIASLQAEMEGLRDRYPQLVKSLEKYWTPSTKAQVVAARKEDKSSAEPFMNTVFDAAQFVDGTDPQYTWINCRPGEARDLPVMLHGNVATPGEIAPRHFLTVLSQGDSTIQVRKLWPASKAGANNFPRCGAAHGARDCESRMGLAFRPASGRDNERFWRTGRKACASGAARRSCGTVHRPRLVAQMAASRDHALRGVPAGQQPAGECGQSGPGELALMAHEPAAPGRRIL